MAKKSPAPAPFVEPKVLVITFAPVLHAQDGDRWLYEIEDWTDPRELMPGYIADLEACSHGYVRYRIVDEIAVDAFPLKKDGFRYTTESFLACKQDAALCHQPDAVDYRAIFRQFDIPKRFRRREIDEVWLWGAGYFGLWESTMAGFRAYFCNSPPVEGVWTWRTFVTMGFNYERGVGEMLEAFGHRVESIMRHVYGSWEHAPMATQTSPHAWNRFTRYDKVAPGEAGCGTVHYAPNSDIDYDWGNSRTVMTFADDWLNYPELTGEKLPMNCAQWGNGDIREHHRWWLTHLPHAEGRGPDGKLNNWWAYVTDFNRFPESRR